MSTTVTGTRVIDHNVFNISCYSFRLSVLIYFVLTYFVLIYSKTVVLKI